MTPMVGGMVAGLKAQSCIRKEGLENARIRKKQTPPGGGVGFKRGATTRCNAASDDWRKRRPAHDETCPGGSQTHGPQASVPIISRTITNHAHPRWRPKDSTDMAQAPAPIGAGPHKGAPPDKPVTGDRHVKRGNRAVSPGRPSLRKGWTAWGNRTRVSGRTPPVPGRARYRTNKCRVHVRGEWNASVLKTHRIRPARETQVGSVCA